MIPFTIISSVVMAMIVAGHQSTTPSIGSCDSTAIASLPLVERPATTDTGQVLVLLLTGDGGWARSDEGVSRVLLSRGGAVIGLNMRSYLSHQRSPDELARDATCIARTYLARWGRPWLMLLGYSRGADLAPFVASRLAPDLRRRITTLTLVSPSQWAGFRFHLIDLIRDVHRAEDLPVAPELEKLTDISIVCISGREDTGALCPRLSGPHLRVVMLNGGHRITGGYETMADWLWQGLRPPAVPLP